MRAYYRATLAVFSSNTDTEVVGALASASAHDGFETLQSDAIEAWEKQIVSLRAAFAILAVEHPASAEWTLLLEYTIPRRQKRLDAVLLAHEVIFAIEFKTGDRSFTLAGRRQVEDYALDLRDFHAASRGRIIIPVLVVARTSAAPSIRPRLR